MYTDSLLFMADGQRINNADGIALTLFDKSIPLSKVSRDVGVGKAVPFLFTLLQPLTGVANIIWVELITASDAAMTADVEILARSGSYNAADLAVNPTFSMNVPEVGRDLDLFLGGRINNTVAPVAGLGNDIYFNMQGVIDVQSAHIR